MVADLHTPARPPRLNPFAFPSDTDFRFVLLIVSVIGSSLFIYSLQYFRIPATRNAFSDTEIRCAKMMPKSPTDLHGFSSPDFVAATAAVEQCRAPAEQGLAVGMLGGVGLLLLVAGLIYWTFPARKIWRDGLVPLSGDDAPEVVAYLAGLCREAGLPRLPIFVWNPLNPAGGGLAFGRLGRYYVTLTGGLVTQFYTDRPAFRAVVHELAHLRNADVNKTYFAVAIWQAFLIVALLPLTVIIFDTDLKKSNLDLVWRVIALVVLVYLTRNAVLRAREVYADVRASVWDGPAGALGRVLESLPHQKVGRWRIALQVHPDPGSRRQALEDPDHLFTMGFWDAFGTGIAAAIVFPNVITMLTSLLTGTGLTALTGLSASLGSALIFAPLAVGVVGSGVWRTTFAALARGKAPSGAGRLGLGLGLGILFGEFLSFQAAFTIGNLKLGEHPTPFGFRLVNVGWSLLLLVSLFFFLRWIAAGASAWPEVAATSRSPRLFYTLGLTIASGVLAIWFGMLFYIRSFGHFGPLLSLLATYGAILTYPLTLMLVVISLWAFPLAAWLGRKRVASASGSSWAFLDSSSEQLALPRQSPFRLGRALTIGLTAGLAFCVLLLIVRIAFRLGLPETVQSTGEYKLTLFYAMVAIAALMQAGVAAIVAGRVSRLGGLHGLFAAFVAGCVMAVGVLGVNLLVGGKIDLQFAWLTLQLVVSGGALLALLAWGVSALAGLVRHARA